MAGYVVQAWQLFVFIGSCETEKKRSGWYGLAVTGISARFLPESESGASGIHLELREGSSTTRGGISANNEETTCVCACVPDVDFCFLDFFVTGGGGESDSLILIRSDYSVSTWVGYR